jgi:hypothetical protein
MSDGKELKSVEIILGGYCAEAEYKNENNEIIVESVKIDLKEIINDLGDEELREIKNSIKESIIKQKSSNPNEGDD